RPVLVAQRQVEKQVADGRDAQLFQPLESLLARSLEGGYRKLVERTVLRSQIVAGRLFRQNQDRVHFDSGTPRQGGHADGGAGRVGLGEIFRHYFVHQREMGEIGQENVEFDDV